MKNKLNKYFKIFKNTFYLSSTDNLLFNYFKSNNKESVKKDVVLVQCVEDYTYFGLFGIIVKDLNRNNDFRIEQYVARSFTAGGSKNIKSAIISILLQNKFRDNKWIKLYSSYCDGLAYKNSKGYSIIHDITAIRKAFKIFKSLKLKEDLINLIIDDIKIGDLIYDTYIRFKPAPTVNIKDFYLVLLIWQSIRNIKLIKIYFNKNKPKILLTSYSTYIQHGITVRIAIQTQTKVYSFGNFQSFSKKLTLNDYNHTSSFWEYKDNFDKLTNKDVLLNKSREALENRLNGKKDIATSYMKKSAYELKVTEVPNIKDAVIVFLHDFFDSPHIYGNMVFPDFLEWIEFTINILEKYKIPFYLKSHPNQISDNIKIIKMLKNKYSTLKFIPSEITNKQLVDSKMLLGISVYGTVAHELVYMGVPVLLCGNNPHSSYNFCYEAEHKEEYIELIKDYKNLKLPLNYKEEVESFYYMHNINNSEAHQILINNFVEYFWYCSDENLNVDEYFTKLNSISENIEFKNFINKLDKDKNIE